MLAATAFAAAAGVAHAAPATLADAQDQAGLTGAAVLDNSASKARAGVQLGYSIPLAGNTLDVYGSWSQAGIRHGGPGWSGVPGWPGGVGGLAAGGAAGSENRLWDGPGKGAAIGVRWNQMLASGGGYESRLSLGADVRGYRANGPLLEVEPGNDVTVAPLSVNVNGNWTLDEGTVSGSVTWLHNIGAPRGHQGDIARLRPGASANYSILRLAGQLTRDLPRDFQVRAGLRGQYTSDVLLPGEQFGAGGAGGGLLVRGFNGRALARDSGLAAHVELYSPELCSAYVRWRCRALVFYDKGYFRSNRDLPGGLRSNTVRSIGVGVRMNIYRNVDLQVDYGRVVRSSIVPQEDKNRLHVRIGMRW
jgi:hemolysin activation/secretion protein